MTDISSKLQFIPESFDSVLVLGARSVESLISIRIDRIMRGKITGNKDDKDAEQKFQINRSN